MFSRLWTAERVKKLLMEDIMTEKTGKLQTRWRNKHKFGELCSLFFSIFTNIVA